SLRNTTACIPPSVRGKCNGVTPERFSRLNFRRRGRPNIAAAALDTVPVTAGQGKKCVDFARALIRDPGDIPVSNIGNVKFDTVVRPKGSRIVQRKIADTSRKQARSHVSETRRDLPVVFERPDFTRKRSALRTEIIPENIEALKLANQTSAIDVASEHG